MADTQINTAPTEPNAKFLSPQEMSAEQFAQFERDGKMIDRVPAKAVPETPDDSADTADSAPAKPAEQVASTDALPPPASETGKPEKKKKGIEARIEQLGQQNSTLESELRRRRELREALDREPDVSVARAKPAVEPSAPAPDASTSDLKKEIARLKALPGAPKISDYEDPDDWGIALSAFVSRNLTEQMLSAHTEQTARSADEQAMIRTVGQKLDAQYEKHADLAAQIDQRFLDIVPSRHLPSDAQENRLNFIKDQVLFECENTVPLGAFYSTPEGYAELAQMRGMNKAQIIRTIAIRDHSFNSDSQDAAVDEGDAPASVHISKAPPPPPVAGRKTAAPSDPLQTAIKAGDYNAFEALENQRVLAKKKK